MRRQVSVRAIVFVLFAVFTAASCERAADLTAPAPAYALNAKKLAKLLGNLGEGTGTPVTVDPRGGNHVASITVGAHTLWIESKAVREATTFAMTAEEQDINGTPVTVFELTATSTRSNAELNDVGSRGFRRPVVLCLDASDVDVTTRRGLAIFWLRDSGSIVPMRLVPRMAEPYVCAELPHFSGFVMGAN